MPRLSSDEAQEQMYGGGGVSQRLTFRERLMNRFAAHEFVRVINIDDEPFFWQYLPQHSETFEYTPDPMKVTHREMPEAWMLEPGKSEVVIGENAYVMIEQLYKKLVATGFLKRNGPNPEKSPGRNFNWSDGKQQEDIINKIYLGKESPEFGSKTSDRTAKVPETPRVTATSGRLRPAA